MPLYLGDDITDEDAFRALRGLGVGIIAGHADDPEVADRAAAAWAEARLGAARGESHVVVLTVGTGIGGGIVIDSELVRGRYGVAAEVGYLNVVPDGRRCGCGLQGCWEQYGSGSALEQDAQEQAVVSPAIAGELLKLAGGRAENITGEMVTEAAKAGDVAALWCFDELGK